MKDLVTRFMCGKVHFFLAYRPPAMACYQTQDNNLSRVTVHGLRFTDFTVYGFYGFPGPESRFPSHGFYGSRVPSPESRILRVTPCLHKHQLFKYILIIFNPFRLLGIFQKSGNVFHNNFRTRFCDNIRKMFKNFFLVFKR